MPIGAQRSLIGKTSGCERSIVSTLLHLLSGRAVLVLELLGGFSASFPRCLLEITFANVFLSYRSHLGEYFCVLGARVKSRTVKER